MGSHLTSSHMTSMAGKLPTSQVTSSIVTMLGVMELMGAAEIKELLGVSRQRVQQLIRRPDFPKPIASLAMGKVWRREDVLRWARERQDIDE
jgi:Prophage CP4-57 regulatory protein (AlpA).